MIKPKILSDEAILEIAHFAIEYPDRDMPQAEQSKQRRRAVAQAQNDYCYKEMLGQIISSLNMRDVGGVEPEWAMSNKQYQALQLEET